MIRLETPRLVIRNWEDRDRDLFFRINSDDRVMRFFPFAAAAQRPTPSSTRCVPATRNAATASPRLR